MIARIRLLEGSPNRWHDRLAARTRCAPFPLAGEGRILACCRVAAPVGYEIDRLIEPHPIFPLIQRHASVDDSEMFEVFNMGIGFCYVVKEAAGERTLAILGAHGRAAQEIGAAVSDPQRIVRIPARGLVGQDTRFWREGGQARRGAVILRRSGQICTAHVGVFH